MERSVCDGGGKVRYGEVAVADLCHSSSAVFALHSSQVVLGSCDLYRLIQVRPADMKLRCLLLVVLERNAHELLRA